MNELFKNAIKLKLMVAATEHKTNKIAIKGSKMRLPVVAVYFQMETLVAVREAFDFVAPLLQLEIVVDCFVAYPCSGLPIKYINQTM